MPVIRHGAHFEGDGPHGCFDSVQKLADTAAKTEGSIVEGRIAGLQPELLRACNKVPSPE
jgi:hypothetical protein